MFRPQNNKCPKVNGFYVPQHFNHNHILGEQVKKPGVPIYMYLYNPETGKHEGTWAVWGVSDESSNGKLLTKEEHRDYTMKAIECTRNQSKDGSDQSQDELER